MDKKEQGILAVIIAHNERKCVQMNVSILLNECGAIGSETGYKPGYEVLVVDNGSNDGLKEWLTGQAGISYMISDQVEGYGTILHTIQEEFGTGRDVLLLRANYLLTPGSIAAMKAVLDQDDAVAAVAPVSNVFAGEQKCAGADTYQKALNIRECLAAQDIVKTAYLDADVLMIRGSTFSLIDEDLAVPRAALRSYRRRVLEQGGSFAVAKKAVCFAVCQTKDEPYQAIDPAAYQYEKIQQLLYAFGDLTYEGIHLYKYLEPDILLGVNYDNRLQDTDRNIGSLVWSAADRVVTSSQEDAAKTEELFAHLPQREVLFVTLLLRRMYHGEFVHTAMEPYMQCLEEAQYLDIECVTDLSADASYPIPTKNRYPLLVTAVPTLYGIPEISKESLYSFLWKNMIHPLEEAVGKRFPTAVVQTCFLKAAFILKERYSFMQFFQKVLITVKPKVVIYSHGQNRLLTYMQDAASALGVPTLEITHGVTAAGVYHKHLMYSDELAAFSDIVEQKSRLLGNDHVIAVGKPGIYEHCTTSHNKDSNIVVLFISSLEAEMLSYAKNLANRLDRKKYLVVYKIHGSELWKSSQITQIEQEIPNLRFAGAELEIRDAVSQSDIVVGIRSSGIFDALPFSKVKIITVRDRTKDFEPAQKNDVLQEVAGRGDLIIAESEEELYQEVLSYRRGKPYRKVPNCFWPADAKRRFQCLVASYT